MLRTFLFLLAFLATSWHSWAQSPDPKPGQAPASTTQPEPQPASTDPNSKKPKTVWTNDNLSDAKGSVSVVGGKGTESARGQSGKKSDAAYISKVRKDLEKLKGEIAAADQQIAKLRQFNSGEPVGTSDRELHKGYNMQPIDQQIQILEAKKKTLQSKIDNLLDEARKRGVESGQLR